MQTYEEFINVILESRGRFACGNGYHERHHILPKCMGGKNDEDNLIDLYASEHFTAHKLLALENPSVDSLIYAWGCMAFPSTQTQQRYELTPEEYEEVRVAMSKMRKGAKNSAEARRKISENHADVSGENNPMYGKHHIDRSRKKISEKAKERYKNPENHPTYGKHRSEATKEKLRESHKGKYDGAKNPRARKVVRLSDLQIYDYLNKAAQENNVCKDTMRKYCLTHTDFMYYDEWLAKQNN
jgi:hypothetical protein